MTHTTAHIPDEAVQAAADKYSDGGGHGLDMPDILEVARDMIAAALPHLAPCAVEVKKLRSDLISSNDAAHHHREKNKKLRKRNRALLSALREVVSAKNHHDANFIANIAIAGWEDEELIYKSRTTTNECTKPVDVAEVLNSAALIIEGRSTAINSDLITSLYTALNGYEIAKIVAEHDKTLGEAIRALSAEPARGGQWQPIETAPRDGSYVLLYCDYYGIGRCAWESWRGVWRSDDANHGIGFPHPTHWMPLPAAPTTEAGK